MNKFIATTLIGVSLIGCLTSCTETTTIIKSEDPSVELSYTAEFYDNHGKKWFDVEGSSFDIRPNKIKEYYYDSEGFWTYKWAMSSIMTIIIDHKAVNTCGNTVLFVDSGLQRYDIEIPESVSTDNLSNSADITAPSDFMSAEDYWTIGWWWDHDQQVDNGGGSRVVVIQSQEGDPICMFRGNDVTWDVSNNLPKTTEICIDGKMLYVHRANFSIINADLLN